MLIWFKKISKKYPLLSRLVISNIPYIFFGAEEFARPLKSDNKKNAPIEFDYSQ